MVRKGGLEPPWAAPLEPKSSASTNSATFAAAFAERVIIAGPGLGRQENAPWRPCRFPTKCSPFGALRQISRVRRPLRKLSRRVAASCPARLRPGRRRDLSLCAHGRRLRRRRRRSRPQARLAALDALRTRARRDRSGRSAAEPPFPELAAAIARHRLPLAPFRDLLSAFRQDVDDDALRDVRARARLLPPLGQSRSAG